MTNDQREEIRQKAIQFVKDHVCCCCPEHLTAFAESLLYGGADSGTTAEATPDNYVAWCRYIRSGEKSWIETCDSDALGAFKVYRGAAPPAASDLILRCSKCDGTMIYKKQGNEEIKVFCCSCGSRAASGGQPAATKTERGFDRIDFHDHYGVACSLQKSSLATEDAIWFGCNDAEPKQLIHGKGWVPVTMPAEYIANTRMHLTREQVVELLPYLKRFVDTGDICERAASGSGTPATSSAPVPNRGILNVNAWEEGSCWLDFKELADGKFILHEGPESLKR